MNADTSKILVIEDEQSLRENIVDMLTFQGFQVIDAPDGETGIHLALEHNPDLIISDIGLSEMSGYDVLLKLRREARTRFIPFIFMSAHGDRNFVRHGMELGADDYLTKPFTKTELIATVVSRLERRQELGQVAGEVGQIKKRLARTVSHELRTPLSAIVMVQDVLSKQIGQLSASETEGLLDTLRQGSFRLHHSVEQLVLMTQLQTGMLGQEIIEQFGVTSELWSILTSAVNLGRRFAYRNHMAPVKLDDRDRLIKVRCNTQTLSHAIAELLANALDFSPEGAEIFVNQWIAEGFVWVSIVDQGQGMSEEQLERALQDFEQIDRENREQQGIGLGLPLANAIIEAHGGTLELKSSPGKGTQATLRLPMVASEK
jgi:signal transduction histidine kinase